jgi:hypothetical protein
MGPEPAVERLLSEAHAAAGPSPEQRLKALDRLEAGLGVTPCPPRTFSSTAASSAPASTSNGAVSHHWLAACALIGALGALGAFSVGRGTAAARFSAAAAHAAASPAAGSAAAVLPSGSASIGAARGTPSAAELHSAPEHQALELLQAAQRSLLDAAPGRALARLEQLEALGPDILVEEREATRVLAWCVRGERDRAIEIASALRDSHPGSAYERRLSESCIGSERRVREVSAN